MSQATPMTTENPAWRIAEPGTRDIINMLAAPEGAAFVEEAAVDLLSQLLGGLRAPQRQPEYARAILRNYHGSADDEHAMRVLLDRSLPDMAALKDETLLAPLLVPKGYRPSSPIGEWVDAILPMTLAKELDYNPRELAANLIRLEGTDPEAFDLLMGGRLGAAIALNRRFAELTGAETDALIRAQAILLYTAATLARAALVRRWATRPMTEVASYEKEWLYQGRAMMTALVEPARQIDAVLQTATAQPAKARLEGSFLQRSNVLALAEAVQRRIPALAGRRSYPEAVRLIEQHMGKPLRHMAAVTRDQLKQEGLGKRDFVEARLGVSASHAVVILSATLLAAPHRIAACMAAVRRGDALPPAPPLAWSSSAARSNRSLARFTQWLRLKERTDRNARSYGNGKDDDKAGHQMVRRTLAAFVANHPHQAVEVLSIDPRPWFER